MTCRVFILLLVLAFPLPASADQPPAAYLRLKEAGTVSFRLGDFAAALSKYSEAYKLHQDPRMLYNIAQCHRHLGHTERAIFFYKQHLERWNRLHPGEPTPVKAAVDKHLAALEAKLRQEEVARRRKVEEEARRRRGAEKPLPAEGATGKSTGRQAPDKGVARGGLDATDRGNKPSPSEPRRSTLWLVAGIGTAALAAGALGVGIAFDLKAQEHQTWEQGWADNTNIGMAGYISAGVLALASGASWFLYWYSGRGELDSKAAALDGALVPRFEAGVAPIGGGAFLSGIFRF